MRKLDFVQYRTANDNRIESCKAGEPGDDEQIIFHGGSAI
jgi:hypothetical protein